MATIGRDGTKLPLWVIANGLTDRVMEKFTQDDRVAREIASGRLHLAHSESGWMDQDVVIEYLKWLSMVARNKTNT